MFGIENGKKKKLKNHPFPKPNSLIQFIFIMMQEM